jgi:hypothetical protein
MTPTLTLSVQRLPADLTRFSLWRRIFASQLQCTGAEREESRRIFAGEGSEEQVEDKVEAEKARCIHGIRGHRCSVVVIG